MKRLNYSTITSMIRRIHAAKQKSDATGVPIRELLDQDRELRTVRHEVMKFMTLEDATGTFEVTLFPRVYRRFGHLLYDRGPYVVRGRVERDGICCTLTALWLGRVRQPGGDV